MGYIGDTKGRTTAWLDPAILHDKGADEGNYYCGTAILDDGTVYVAVNDGRGKILWNAINAEGKARFAPNKPGVINGSNGNNMRWSPQLASDGSNCWVVCENGGTIYAGIIENELVAIGQGSQSTVACGYGSVQVCFMRNGEMVWRRVK
jgi:outer membrane protein assembly factor BamB